LLLVLAAHAAPTRGAAPSTSATTGSSARAPVPSGSASQRPAVPEAPRAKESSIERVATEIAVSFPSAPQALLVAGPALRSDEPLSPRRRAAVRALSVVSGKLPAARAHREP